MSGQQSSLKVSGRGGRGDRWRAPAVCLALAAITFAVFGQTLGFQFVNYDDRAFYGNPAVADGFSLQGLAWAFTHTVDVLYHPITILSFMADHQLYGLHPGGYHFTNVLLHTASAILLFLIFHQMTGALWRSAFVAAVFAIHPLRVESVAWVAERKDVLAAFFFMLTVGAYVRYVRNPKSLGRYLMVAAAFVLALLSKPSVVTLPFVLLLLDYWPLRRIEQPEKLRGLILEKIPLLALAAGGCLMAVLTVGKASAADYHGSMLARVGNAPVYYVVYLRQMVWPQGLAVVYPYPPNGQPAWEMVLAAVLLGAISAAAWRVRRSRPWFLIGWLWYLCVFAPMIGLKPAGAYPVADRYTYLPQIGIYLAVTWLVAELRLSRAALAALMAGVLALLTVCAWKQTAYWQNSETLWTHTLACTTGNSTAEFSLGNALLQDGRPDEGIAHLQRAAQIRPDYAEAYNNLGNAFVQKGNMAEAISSYQQAMQIAAADPLIKNNLAWILATCPDASLRNAAMAVELAEQANALSDGGSPFVLGTLAAAYAEAGRFPEAVATAQRALQIAEMQSRTRLAGQIQSELKFYQAGNPYRSPQ